MNSNYKILITAIVATAIGLGIGYFIFGNKVTSDMENQEHAVADTAADAEVWTCSMHPQIRQNEPGACAICGMDLIPLEANSSNDPLVLEMTSEAVKLSNIQTSIVEQASGQAGNEIRLSGKVQPDERLASSQVAHVPGRIEKLFVSFTGERVSKGQKIASLYSPDLVTAQRELLEAIKLQAINPGLLEAARNKLRYWKIGETTIQQIEQQGTIQETFLVYADGAGIVSKKRVAVGDYVQKGEPLFDLMNLGRVWVLFDAYEEQLASIHLGDKITFTTPSRPDKTFITKVTFIDPLINPATRVAAIRTEVNNPNGILKPEMLVYGSLQKRSETGTQLTVPKSAVLWTGTRSVVYVNLPDTDIPSFEFREVQIGKAIGDEYHILNGLEIGEEIVTYGSFTIDAAAQLNNQASMMNRNVHIKNEKSASMLPDYTASTIVEFKQQLAQLATAYLSLKDALVLTSNKDAISAAQGISEKLEAVDMNLVTADAHLYWMEQLTAISQHNQSIIESGDIELQRKQFEFLSQALIKSLKVFGVSEDTFYVQHCPMVNGNQGADWISTEEEIRNPYFGDKMLTCGLVKTTIDQDYKNPVGQSAKNAPQNVHSH